MITTVAPQEILPNGRGMARAAVANNTEPISVTEGLPIPRGTDPRAPAFSLTAMAPEISQQWTDLARVQTFAARTVLFHQGEHPAGVYQVRRGAVKLSTTSSKGRAVILRIARAGELLGLASTLSGEVSVGTAETLAETEVTFMECDLFVAFLLRHPEAAVSVARQACSIYKSAYRQISLLGLYHSARERLAQFLLNWTASKPVRETPAAWLGLTHEEISQMAGTTRETVTRTLIDFRKKGWASLASSNLVIKDREALEKFVA